MVGPPVVTDGDTGRVGAPVPEERGSEGYGSVSSEERPQGNSGKMDVTGVLWECGV